MPKYEKLSETVSEAIRLARETGEYTDVSFPDSLVVRRQNLAKDAPTVWRPTFVHDIDKIIHCPFYNRYTDKTQVFSLYKNDDITRRSLHVQLVSRISRPCRNQSRTTTRSYTTTPHPAQNWAPRCVP